MKGSGATSFESVIVCGVPRGQFSVTKEGKERVCRQFPIHGTQGKDRSWPSDQKSSIIIGALQAGLEVEVLAEVRVQEGEPLENALRRFKRKVQTEDIIKEVKRHSYYLKPGEKRRVKAALARKRNRKKARKEQD
jgi:small subunit ribosomal protein S21